MEKKNAKDNDDGDGGNALVDALPYVDAIGAEVSWRPRVDLLIKVGVDVIKYILRVQIQSRHLDDGAGFTL